MIFYHGTSEENWDKIKQEGILFGERETPSRCTYLATTIEEAEMYGEVVLRVEYEPSKHPKENNYAEGCWQVRVYEPIEINQISRIK